MTPEQCMKVVMCTALAFAVLFALGTIVISHQIETYEAGN
jgi:hypothetical protein